jgi:3-methyl-2-oxobutanoate hydroxymethyltransferase
VEEAGAFALVLEGVPLDLAQEVTERLSIPTIGIGAGPYCDGQILVLHDLLGLGGQFSPKFVKQYADLQGVISQAVRAYIEDVQGGAFPLDEHSFH